MPYAHEASWRKAHAASRGGQYLVIDGEDPHFMADLKALLPEIPATWQRIEIYAPPRDKERDVPLRQVWVLGDTGEVLIDAMVHPYDGLIVRVDWFREPDAPEGTTLEAALASRVLDLVNQTIMRHRAGGRRVH